MKRQLSEYCWFIQFGWKVLLENKLPFVILKRKKETFNH